MNDRTVLAVLVAWILTTVIYGLTSVSLLQYLSVTGLLAIGTAVYYLSEREILIEDVIRREQQQSSGKAIESLQLQRVENTLESFSDEFYSDEDQIDVRWDLADYDTVNLDSKGEEALLAVTGALGQNDRKIQVFIHLPSYKIPTHKRIRAGTHQEKYPFKYCDYYQESQSGQNEDLRELTQQPPYGPYYGSAMPPNRGVDQKQSQDSDGED